MDALRQFIVRQARVLLQMREKLSVEIIKMHELPSKTSIFA
jgi:hypothetical protein